MADDTAVGDRAHAQVATQGYDRGRYAHRLDYRREPVPPLSPEDAAWADARLRQQGRR
jgi:hypothetical protein